jgi:selT/selW/selH-like putative selenoprotein
VSSSSADRRMVDTLKPQHTFLIGLGVGIGGAWWWCSKGSGGGGGGGSSHKTGTSLVSRKPKMARDAAGAAALHRADVDAAAGSTRNGGSGGTRGASGGVEGTSQAAAVPATTCTTNDVNGASPHSALPVVSIEYCTGCRWMMRAAWTAQELLTTFDGQLGGVTLTPNSTRPGGAFEVRIDQQMVFSRKVSNPNDIHTRARTYE